MYLDYPADALKKAAAEALCHGLFDTSRIERMVLRTIAGKFFQLPLPEAAARNREPKDPGEDQAGENEKRGNQGENADGDQ